MPPRTHLVAVARKLKQELDGKAFLTIQRTEVTELLREVLRHGVPVLGRVQLADHMPCDR